MIMTKKLQVGDRVQSRITWEQGTVTMGGRTIAQVKFDNAVRPLARFVKDLEVIKIASCD